MKWLKVLGGIAYALAFLVVATMFLGYDLGLNPTKNIYLFLALGAIGFLLNLASFSRDKLGNPRANFIYWLGCFIVFIGLAAKIMHYPLSIELLILGAIIIFVSIFRYKKSIAENRSNEDILDQS